MELLIERPNTIMVSAMAAKGANMYIITATILYVSSCFLSTITTTATAKSTSRA